MRKIFQYILMTVALVATASCSNELDEVLQPAGNGSLQFVVSDFPAFGEGPDTRVIGTQDVGKTAWDKDDQIIVTLTSKKFGAQSAVLTYNGTSWSTAVSFLYLDNETPAVSAIYAPCYEVTEDGVMKLSDGMQLGMTEYIPADCSLANGSISINFTGVKRTYSRLRLAGLANQTLTVTTTDFTPAGATEVATAAYTLTTDDNGNAFLYGTFAVGATVSVTQGDIEIGTHAFASATEECVSYALDAMSPYVYDEATNTYTVYTAKGLLDWSEKVRDIFATGVFNYEIDAYEYEEDFPNLSLAADITLTGENNWTPIGGKDEDGSLYYTGTINGGGHTITGLHINNESNYQGFIGMLGEGGTVKNLTFADAHVTVGQYSGIVVGDNLGTIEDCHVTSGSLTANGDYAGGIVGSNAQDCIVKNCTNAATITVAQGASAGALGGIAGNNNFGIILGCINTGDISSDNYCIGGVLGDNAGIVVACSNKGTVTGTGNTGGIVGRNAASFAQTIGSWTIATNESDAGGDGVGHTNGTVTGCFTGDAATINGKVSEINAAIATYNETATVNCPYTWEAGTDGYPTLVKSE